MKSEMREMEVCEIWERWTPAAWDEEDLGKRITMVMEEGSSAPIRFHACVRRVAAYRLWLEDEVGE